jgi:hypothetical protein
MPSRPLVRWSGVFVQQVSQLKSEADGNERERSNEVEAKSADDFVWLGQCQSVS